MEKPYQETWNLRTFIQNSILLKAAMVGIIALSLLIPTLFVSNLNHERALRRDSVIKEVSDKWGEEQVITGPLLSIPYLETVTDENGKKTGTTRHFAFFTPEKLDIKGQIEHELRKRSIYEVMLYTAKLTFTGSFLRPEFEKLSLNYDQLLWDEAFICLGISDVSAIADQSGFKWSGDTYEFQPGLPARVVLDAGIHTDVPLSDREDFNFESSLTIKGSERISFVPIGKSTSIEVSSAWPDPSFNGNQLPVSHQVDDTGFRANWKIVDLNRNIPNEWVGPMTGLDDSAVGVTMLIPVNEYQKNDRSTKHSILIIALTFVTFFLVEVIKKSRLHPFHYLLAGLALVVFYLLLLSFSEHIGFDYAYLVSGVMTIFLIVGYMSAVLRNRSFTVLLAIFFSILYAYIYVILQLQDYALVVGTLGIFAALACMMYLTRNINWYDIIHQTKGPDNRAE